MQAWTCIERSSRAPNAPPTPASVSRTFSGGRSEAGGDLVLVHVQPLGGDVEVDAAVLGGDGEAGLRAEEGLVLHADLVLAGDDDVGRRPSGSPCRSARAAGCCRRVQRRRVGVERALGRR